MKSIEHNDDQIALLHGERGLLTNRLVKNEVLLSNESARVDQREWEVVAGNELIVSISGHTSLVLHNSSAFTHERVEER
jgi:hypothetical protein